MPLISVTRLRIRSIRFLPAFFWRVLRSQVQARRSPGNLGSRTLRDAHLAFWTASAWESESAMRAFMLSGAHRRAMPKLLDWCDEASVVHWHQDTPDLPEWKEAHRRLVAEGRPSKVYYPSPGHQRGHIPEPQRP